MQFSIDRLFEMIEERLGRFWANAFLAIVVVALAILGMKIIIVDGIGPLVVLVSDFMRGNEARLTWNDLTPIMISGFLPGLSLWVAYRLFWMRRFDRNDTSMAAVERLTRLAYETGEEARATQIQFNSGIAAEVKYLTEEVTKVKERLDRIEDGLPPIRGSEPPQPE